MVPFIVSGCLVDKRGNQLLAAEGHSGCGVTWRKPELRDAVEGRWVPAEKQRSVESFPSCVMPWRAGGNPLRNSTQVGSFPSCVGNKPGAGPGEGGSRSGTAVLLRCCTALLWSLRVLMIALV